MNHIFKLVWSGTSRMWVAVSESAAGHGKSTAVKSDCCAVVGAALIAATAFAAPAWALGPNVLPSGGSVSSGKATISQSALTLNVQQTTQQAAINWQSFNIGSAATVNFQQPNSSSVALNRIGGTQASQIYGHLNANGQVFLLNPNGMLFAPGSQVNVGGLLASTLKLSDFDFMSGNYTFSNPGTGGIINQGTINASGSIALLGNTVQNVGQLYATTVTLAAGNTVAVDLTVEGLIRARVSDASLSADLENSGSINAATSVTLTAGQVGSTVAQVVNNSGIIRATGFSQEGGQIVLQGGTVSNSGTINSTGAQGGGSIALLGGMTAGSVKVSGILDASAPQAGNGGSIETSAAHVSIADGVSITTAAAHGKSGNWLIDPVDFTIAASGGDITGQALGTLLASNSVTIQTTTGTNSGTNLYANGAVGPGNINVSDPVSWSANTALTLNAFGNVNINQPITATGASGALNVQFGQGAVALGNTATFNVNAPINLSAGPNFSKTLGSNGVATVYTVITSLGSPGDEISAPTTTTLQGMAASSNLAGNFVLGANIDATSTLTWNSAAGFVPIGGNPNANGATTNFTGQFDGLGHTISNLTINSNLPFTALFGQAAGSSFSNIGLVGGSFTNSALAGVTAPLVAQGSNISVTNSYAQSSVTSTNSGVLGGLIGIASNSTISNSSASGSVTSLGPSGGFVGGLVGESLAGSITNSSASGSVSASNGGISSVGGLVGWNTGTITSSNAAGIVSVTDTGSYVSQAGGLVGQNQGTISASGASGPVSNSETNGAAGGLVGYNTSTGIITGGSFETGTVSDSVNGNGNSTHIGGLVGQNDGSITGSINNENFAQGNVTAYGAGWIGGLVGINSAGTGSIIYSHATGNVIASGSSRTYVGGLTGQNDGTISNAYATGNVSAAGTNSDVGGLVGYNTNLITGSYWGDGITFGTVSFTGPSGYVGGLVGVSGSVAGGAIISGSAATGNVSATNGAGSLIVGGLVGYNANGTSPNTIQISTTTGTVAVTTTTNSGMVGGLVGDNASTIINSTSSSAVAGVQASAGGLVGSNESTGTITLSNASGAVSDISGNNLAAGGLVGVNNGSIATSYATGSVNNSSGVATSTGGLVGLNVGSITGSNASGNVSVTDTGSSVTPAGGLVGQNRGTISGSSASGAVVNYETNGAAGGLVGYNTSTGVITGGSFETGNVSDSTNGNSTHIGGLVGQNDGSISGTVSAENYATGNVISVGTSGWIGGLVGINSAGVGLIIYSYATGSVTTAGSSQTYVGGLTGQNDGNIVYAYANGFVVASGASTYVGGLVGYNRGTVAQSYATGAVSGSGVGLGVGGLIGYNSGVVSDAYANGSVATSTGASSAVAGLVGENVTGGTIANSYSTGAVSASAGNVPGGLIGINLGGVTSSFWDTTTSGQATSAGGTGLTTAQMQSASVYSGWSISNIGGSGLSWRVYEGNTYPLLTIFLTPLTLASAPDALNLTYSGVPQTAGSYTLTANVFGSAATGTNVGFYNGYYSNQLGYDITGGNISITPAALVATGTQTYNGTTTFAGSNLIISGVNGETFTASGSGTLTGIHVQTNQALASVSGFVLAPVNGDLLSNYLPLAATATSVSVTQAPITTSASITGSTTKVYDGTTAATGATFSTNVTGAVSGDTITVNTAGVALAYNSAHVIGASSIVPTGSTSLSISGTAGSALSDYSYSLPTIAPVAATITTAPLTTSASITGSTTKVYDGTTAATGATFATNVTGAVAGDTITVNTIGVTLAYNSAHVVGASSIVPTGSTSLSISGTAASVSTDYSYTLPTIAPVAATITTAPLTMTASIGGSTTKVYDGTTAASGATVAGQVAGAVAGDTIVVDVSGMSLNYNSAHVGATTILATGNAGISIAASTVGSVLSDYSFTQPRLLSASGSITPATLSYVADPVGLLPGQALPSVLTGTVSGFVPGDTLANATTGTLSFFAPQTANFIAGNSYAIDGRGLTAVDYVLAQADSNATALIAFNPVQVTQAVSASIAQSSTTPTSATTDPGSTTPPAGGISFVLIGKQPATQSGGPLVNNNLPGTSVLVCK